jgi:hypothetical protein
MDAAPGLVALHFAADDNHARALIAAYIAAIARRLQPPSTAPPASPTGRRSRRAAAASACAARAAADGFEPHEAVAWLHVAHPCPGAGWRAADRPADDGSRSSSPGPPSPLLLSSSPVGCVSAQCE